MPLPIVCFTCGHVLAHLWTPYSDMLRRGHTEAEALHEVGLGSCKQYCCRNQMLTNVDDSHKHTVETGPRSYQFRSEQLSAASLRAEGQPAPAPSAAGTGGPEDARAPGKPPSYIRCR